MEGEVERTPIAPDAPDAATTSSPPSGGGGGVVGVNPFKQGETVPVTVLPDRPQQQQQPQPQQQPSSQPSRKRFHDVDPLTGFEPGKKSARTEASTRMRRKAMDKEIRELASEVGYECDAVATAVETENESAVAKQQRQRPASSPPSSSGGEGAAAEEEPRNRKQQQKPMEKKTKTPTTSPSGSPTKRPAPLDDPVTAAVDPERFEIYRVDRKRSDAVGEGVVVVEVADVGTKQVRRERRWQPKHFDSACCGRWFVSLDEMEAALPAASPDAGGRRAVEGAGEDKAADDGSWSDAQAAAHASYSSEENGNARPSRRRRKTINPDQPPTETTYRSRVESYYDCLDAHDGGNIHVTLSNLGRSEAVRAVAHMLRKVGDLVSVVSRVTKRRAGTSKHRIDYRVTAYVKLAKDFAAVHAAAAEVAAMY